MTGATSPRPSDRGPFDVVGSMLLLIVPFWSYLHLQAYSVLRPEALALSAILVMLGGAYGVLVQHARSDYVRVVLIAVLVIVSIDLMMDIHEWRAIRYVAVVGGTWLLRTHIMRILTLMSLAYLVSAFAAGPTRGDRIYRATTPSVAANLPPLVHLIVDAHIGPEGLPMEQASGRAAKAALVQYYTQRGFRLFTRAYSRYYMTENAIPNELNFTASRTKSVWMDRTETGGTPALLRNAYFRRLEQAGYETNVYHPPFIDFCETSRRATRSCYMAPSMSHLPLLHLGWTTSTWYLAVFWLQNESSSLFQARQLYEFRLRKALVSLGWAAPRWEWLSVRLGQAGALAITHRMADDIATVPSLRGEAFFSHVLLPHLPYLVNENCEGNADIAQGMLPDIVGRRRPLPEARRARYAQYGSQLACVRKLVDTVLSKLDARVARDAVVIVQGDHGSRIGSTPALGQPLSRQSFDDFYSTLFAIRGPGITSGTDTTVVSLEDLLDRYSAARFTDTTFADSAPYVLLGEVELPARHLVPAPVPKAR